VKLLINKMKDKEAAEKVRKLGTIKWNPGHADVAAYRVQLLEAQNYTCPYCRSPIHADTLGYREIDHILPKSQTPSEPKDFDAVRACSNMSDDRRHTRGYKEFTYTPENLVVTCKHCNSSKGAYDGLADRTTHPANYPSQPKDFLWVNPHCTDPKAHVEILANYVFRAKAGSPEGKAVITECRLDKVEQLKLRALDAIVFPLKDLITAMIVAVLNLENFESEHIANALHAKHSDVPLQLLKDAVHEMREQHQIGQGAGLLGVYAGAGVVMRRLAELLEKQAADKKLAELNAV
jgi:5-methylcytosine-specific restriction endonuclease McrA